MITKYLIYVLVEFKGVYNVIDVKKIIFNIIILYINMPQVTRTRTPTFTEWMKSVEKKSPNKTPDGDFSFADCHGPNDGSEKTTPERRPSNKCKSSPSIFKHPSYKHVQKNAKIPRRTISTFPVINDKYNYIPPGCGGYKKIRRTRKKSKKSAKRIKKNLRKTKNNKKK